MGMPNGITLFKNGKLIESFEVGGGGIPSSIDLAYLLSLLTGKSYEDCSNEIIDILDPDVDPKTGLDENGEPGLQQYTLPVELFVRLDKLTGEQFDKVFTDWRTMGSLADYDIAKPVVKEILKDLIKVANSVVKNVIDKIVWDDQSI